MHPVSPRTSPQLQRSTPSESLSKIAQTFQVTLQQACFEAALEACRQGKWELIGSCKDELTQLVDEQGRSLLLYAMQSRERKISEELISQGIALQCCDPEGNTPLHSAALRGDAELIALLCKHIPINSKNRNGKTPLQLAIDAGHFDVFARLLFNGADKNEAVKGLIIFSPEKCFETTKDWTKTMNEARRWASHIPEVLKSVEQKEDEAALLMGMGKWEQVQAHYSEAVIHYTRALEIRKAALGDKHPDVASSLNNIADCYSSQRQRCSYDCRWIYGEALKLNSQAMEMRKAALGDKHPDVATSLNSVAIGYLGQWNYEEALKLNSQALEMRKAAFGDKHPDVATSLNNIANCYKIQGNFEEALKLYNQALEIRKAALGDKHPDVANSLNDIADCYCVWMEGNYEEGLKLYTQALEIRKAALGDKHPDVASILSSIASYYFGQGNYEEALKLNFQALEIEKAAFVENRNVDISLLMIELCQKKLNSQRSWCTVQ